MSDEILDRRAEETLRLAQFALDRAGMGIYWIRPDASLAYANEAACRALGYAREELLRMAVPQIDPDFPAERWPAHWQEIKRRGAFTFESRHRARDGRIFPVEITVNYMRYDGHEYNCAIARDITDRKRAEEALRESEQRYRQLVELSPDAIFIQCEGKIAFINTAGAKLLGAADPADLVGTPILDRIHPDYRPVVRQRINGLRRGEPARLLEETYLRLDGTPVDMEVAALPFTYQGKPAAQVMARDITDRKRAQEERRRLEAQVQHAQKLESLGVLAGGIAHDFNNLLVGILGNAGLALMEVTPGSPASQYLRLMEAAALRAADLANQMLAYSGKGRFLTQEVHLSDLIREMAELLQVSASRKAQLRYDLAADLPPVEADATQLRQVVMNLVTNASDALADSGGVVSVVTGTVQVDADYLRQAELNETLQDGTHVFLEVTDTGCGMDAATRAKIFDPFFSTKFSGRGLGLAVVLGIVRGHHGAIKVYSEIGRGSTFRVLFPATARRAPAAAPPEAAPPQGQAGGTVLVVDDESAVRQVAKGALEKGGFKVLLAEDGRRGVEVFRRHAGEIVAVLLDMTMPDMGGDQAFAEIRAIRPDARVILSSGFGEQDTMARFDATGLAGFVQKPYRPDTLLEKIHEALRAL